MSVPGFNSDEQKPAVAKSFARLLSATRLGKTRHRFNGTALHRFASLLGATNQLPNQSLLTLITGGDRELTLFRYPNPDYS